MVGLSTTTKDAIRRALGRPAYVPPEEAAYRRLLGKGFRPAAIIDVGAGASTLVDDLLDAHGDFIPDALRRG